MDSAPASRPVFVGGSPRSGTTLLRVMLHAHPDIAVPREIRLTLGAFLRRHRIGNLRSEKNRTALIDWLIDSHNGFERLLIDESDARATLTAAAPTIGSFVGTLLRMYAQRHGTSRFGEKRPLNVIAHRALFAMFPTLQFIDIVRDPRAVIASVRKLGWLDEHYNGSVPRALDGWVRAIRTGLSMESRLRPDQYMRVRYEDLVASPEGDLQRLCRFAQLDESGLERMLRYYEVDDEIPEDMRDQFHPLVNQPLTPESNERWRGVLTADEVAFIEAAAAPEMDRFGYQPIRTIDLKKSIPNEWRRLQAARPIKKLKWMPLFPYPLADVDAS